MEAFNEAIFDEAVAHLKADIEEYSPVKTYILFSGGNDSTILTHHLWHTGLADAAVHINTGIGIPETRTFVREFCKQYEIPLIEKHPPNVTYEEWVLNRKQGFPGPAGHRWMYIHLKQDAVRELVREAKTKKSDRVLLVTGQRRSESSRRMRTVKDESRRIGAQVWSAPYMDVEKSDLHAYRLAHDVPENEVAAVLHMSGECLCGAFAKEGELEEIEFWYPETGAYLRSLEERAREAGLSPCAWGYGARAKSKKAQKEEIPGPLCSDCPARLA